MSMNQHSELTIKQIEQEGIIYSIKDENNTASIIGYSSIGKKINIPRSIKYNSKDFLITSISKNSFENSLIESIEFSPDSEIRTIEEYAFNRSQIQSLTIPSSLVELKKNWCSETWYLNKINIDPKNPRYKLYEDKIIIGKKSIDDDEYEILIFCKRDTEELIIPNFIKIISSNSFQTCEKLKKIEILNDSKLQTIENESFCSCVVESLFIPDSLINLEEGWCWDLHNLKEIIISTNNPMYFLLNEKMIIGKSSIKNDFYDVLVYYFGDDKIVKIPSFIKIIGACAFNGNKLNEVEIQSDSQLQEICDNAFAYSSIQKISIPQHVVKIGYHAFLRCVHLNEFEVPLDSELQIYGKEAFYSSTIKNIIIPSNLIEIQEYCFLLDMNINKIVVSSDNKYFINYEDKYLIKKSDKNNVDYDILMFALYDIENALIPSFVTNIWSGVFNNHQKLRNVEFQSNSKLQRIYEHAFSFSSIGSLSLPQHLTKIDENAFYGCEKLQIIEINENSKIECFDKRALDQCGTILIMIPVNLKNNLNGLFPN